MKKLTAVLVVILGVLADVLYVGADASAASMSRHCRSGRVGVVAGMKFNHLKVNQRCAAAPGSRQVGGESLTGRVNRITIYAGGRVSKQQVEKARLHEMAHQVVDRTTPAHRRNLYRAIGVNSRDGRQIYGGPYRGMAEWRTRPDERIAESIVQCKFGSPNHRGMRLVKKSQCRAFVRQFDQAARAAR